MPAVGQTALLFAIAAVALTAAEPAPTIEARKATARELLDGEEFRAALEEAEAINRAMPDEIAGYQLMAAAQLGLGDYDAAERQLQWMLDLRIGKTDTAGWLLLARFREETGDVEGALEAVSLAGAHLAPEKAQERRSLLLYAGRLNRDLGKLDQAEFAANAVLAGSEADPEGTLLLAQVRAAQGNREEAIRLLRGIRNASDPRLLYSIAEITRAPADYAVFENAARQVTETTRNANRELALYYAGPGKKPAQALEAARREADRRHDVFTLDALAVAYSANHQMPEAQETMRRVLAAGTRAPEILRHAARIGVKAP